MNNRNIEEMTPWEWAEQQLLHEACMIPSREEGYTAGQNQPFQGMGRTPSQAPYANMGLAQRMPIQQAQFARTPIGFAPQVPHMQAQRPFLLMGTSMQQYAQQPQFAPSPLPSAAPGQHMSAQQPFLPSGMYGQAMARGDSGYSSASTSSSPQRAPSAPSQKRGYEQMAGSPAVAAASLPQAKRTRPGILQNIPPSFGTPEWQAAQNMFRSPQVPPSPAHVSSPTPFPLTPMQVTGAQQAMQMMGTLQRMANPVMKTPSNAPVQQQQRPYSSHQPPGNANTQQHQPRTSNAQPPKRTPNRTPTPTPSLPTLRRPVSYAPPAAPQAPRPLSLEEQIKTFIPRETARLQAIEDKRVQQEACQQPKKTQSIEELAVAFFHGNVVHGPATYTENSDALLQGMLARMRKYGPACGTTSNHTVAAEAEQLHVVRVRWTVRRYLEKTKPVPNTAKWAPAETIESSAAYGVK